MTNLATANSAADPLVERILDEGPMGMAAAARLLGSYRGDRPTHPSTLTRYHLHGVRLPDGQLLRLEAVRVGGRLMTSRSAIVRFISAQQTQLHSGDSRPQPLGSSTSGSHRAELAARELEKYGI